MRKKLQQKFGLFMQNKSSYLINIWKKKLIKENFIPPWGASPLARVHMENFHFT